MGLSILGIFHTVIGVGALIGATVSLVKTGKIDLSRPSGLTYFYLTIVTCISAVFVSKQPGLDPGKILSILVAMLVLMAFYLSKKKPGKNRARIIENLLLTFTLFLSMIPTTNETLSRLPVSHPLAHGPQDPLIKNTILVFFVLFILGSVLQFRKQKRINKVA